MINVRWKGKNFLKSKYCSGTIERMHVSLYFKHYLFLFVEIPGIYPAYQGRINLCEVSHLTLISSVFIIFISAILDN